MSESVEVGYSRLEEMQASIGDWLSEIQDYYRNSEIEDVDLGLRWPLEIPDDVQITLSQIKEEHEGQIEDLNDIMRNIGLVGKISVTNRLITFKARPTIGSMIDSLTGLFRSMPGSKRD